MEISTIGLDLAKNIFRVHGVDPEGNVVVPREAAKIAGRLLQQALDTQTKLR